MAWRCLGDMPLSEPMMVSLPTHICVTQPQWVNSLATGRWDSYCKSVIFRLIQKSSLATCCKIKLRWMPKKSTLVQIMAWCCQATSHYLSQCWPRSIHVAILGSHIPKPVKWLWRNWIKLSGNTIHSITSNVWLSLCVELILLIVKFCNQERI